jgi:hypothetical protein
MHAGKGFQPPLPIDLPQVSLEWVLIGYIQVIMRSVLNLKRRTRETCKTRHSLIFTGNNNKISRGRESAGVFSLGPVYEFVCISFRTGNLNCFRVDICAMAYVPKPESGTKVLKMTPP